jgi:hypothetical protein
MEETRNTEEPIRCGDAPQKTGSGLRVLIFKRTRRQG